MNFISKTIQKTIEQTVNHNITLLNSWTEHFISLPPSEQYKEKGTLSPSEFLQSGTFLIDTCKTWEWSTGENKKSYLPDQSQFLLSKQLAFSPLDLHHSEVISEEGFQQLVLNSSPEVIPDLDSYDYYTEEKNEPSIDLFHLSSSEYVSVNEPEYENTLRFDLSITYDRYYQTPRLWIHGTSSPEYLLSLIGKNWADQSTTIEKHPHLPLYAVSIHPCNHSKMIKKMYEHNQKLTLNEYMFVFLKFISCMIPELQYDYTFEV